MVSNVVGNAIIIITTDLFGQCLSLAAEKISDVVRTAGSSGGRGCGKHEEQHDTLWLDIVRLGKVR